MNCGGCGDTKKDLFCARCLKEGLKKHTEANQILHTQLKASKTRSQVILYGAGHPNIGNGKEPSISSSLLSSLPDTPGFKHAEAVRRSHKQSTPGSTSGLDEHRDLSAKISQLKSQNLALDREVARLKATSSEKRVDVRGRKAEVEQRRARLKRVCQPPPDTTTLQVLEWLRTSRDQPENKCIPALTSDLDVVKHNLSETARANSQVYSQLVHARRVLVSEAITIFGIQRTDSMDSGLSTTGRRRAKVSDNRGTQAEEEWEIAGLQMPSPEMFTGISFVARILAFGLKTDQRSLLDDPDYPSIHLNAVFDHMIHLLWTITGYLDLVLPFTPQWQGSANSTNMDVSAADDTPSGSMADFASLDQYVMDWKGSGLQYASSALNAFGRAVPRGTPHPDTSGSTTFASQSHKETTVMAESSETHHNVPRQQVRTPHIGKIFITATVTAPYLRLPTDVISAEQGSDTLPNPHPFLQKRPLLNVSSSRDKWKKRQWKREAQLRVQGDHRPSVDPQRQGGEAVPAVRDKHKEKEDHLNLAYAMLMMDVLYIAQSQGVLWVKEILDETGDSADTSSLGKAIHSLLVNPLRLLDDLRWSPGLGSLSHGPSALGSLRSIDMPLNFVAFHTAVTAVFAKNPYEAMGSKGREAKMRQRDHVKGGDQTGGDLDADDWDLV
ncbi:hypothetical protein QFC21_000204 [Naganishia friedmannii]|uniref:Uncharacterized protein n=1 Tax=Naganishia friedmannii TaxID=89922 RepID=A0ACC2WBN7_9TREE|nr:hypothetical protein QFC21_000204 [Naganishia friedmannii]